jgi:chromosome segregation ATPase
MDAESQLLAEKDAEIERLQSKIKARESVSQLQDEREKGKDAEIERFLADKNTQLVLMGKAFVAKDAEIERLKEMESACNATLEDAKAEIERLQANIVWLEARNNVLAEMRQEDKAFITELADALVTEEIMFNEGDDLIQRAREATKQ